MLLVLRRSYQCPEQQTEAKTSEKVTSATTKANTPQPKTSEPEIILETESVKDGDVQLDAEIITEEISQDASETNTETTTLTQTSTDTTTMSIPFIGLSVVQCVVAFLLIVVVLQQSKNATGMTSNTMTGGGENTYWSQNKGRSRESKLSKMTVILAVIFFVITVALGFIK